MFGTLHTLLVLIGSGQLDAARETVASLQTAASVGITDQSGVARDVGSPLAAVIMSFAENATMRTPLVSMAQRLSRIGGSHAQRDVFLRTLLLMAADNGDQIATAHLRTLRLNQRHHDRFTMMLDRRARRVRPAAQSTPLAAMA